MFSEAYRQGACANSYINHSPYKNVDFLSFSGSEKIAVEYMYIWDCRGEFIKWKKKRQKCQQLTWDFVGDSLK